ncbi:glycosyltransferase family 4 protein [Acuticoccus yangtzensis]|uniref:glycosyltransferase family 4 protein n=1 Tax=Acuticoccus yangtzensis TaxID=1443441 RepID=UPI0009498A14|nr:glycosyltransferase family 4 protein [Acuticoccus yangtzensis]
MTGRPRIAVLVERIGAYHRARLSALAERAEVMCVELCAADATYAWARHEGHGGDFARTTLFATEAEAADIALLKARMEAALAGFGPDTVAVPGWGYPFSLVALALTSRARTRGGAAVGRVLMSDSQAIDAPRRLLAEMVKRAVVSFADAGLAAGRTHADYLAALGLPRRRIALGLDVVDNAHFAAGAAAARAGPGADAPAFLALARFVRKKNLTALVTAHGVYARAARAEGRTPWRLVIVGDGPESGAIAEAASETGEAVEIRPFAAYDALPGLYAAAGALVLPSTAEQWGLVVNEAMAAGCPVIASVRAGAAAELIIDGVNGHVTAPDVGSVAAALARMEGADRAVICANARASIAAWGPHRFADGILAAAEMAMARRRTPVPPALLYRLAVCIAGAAPPQVPPRATTPPTAGTTLAPR